MSPSGGRVAVLLRGLPERLRQRLRKKTGSYYTPPEVVRVMVRLVDEALRSGQRFALPEALASADVTVADPATTGTFLLSSPPDRAHDGGRQGPGVVPAVVAAVSRLIGFEMQFGRSRVAAHRLAELRALLDDPDSPLGRLFGLTRAATPTPRCRTWRSRMPLGESRRPPMPSSVRRRSPSIIGNPPYVEGEGPRRLDRERLDGQRDRPRSASGCLRRTGTAPMPSSATSTSISGGGRLEGLPQACTNRTAPDRRRDPSRTEGRLPDRRGAVSFITVAWLSGRTRLSDDARGAAPGSGRDLGHRLLAGGASAGGADAHLPGRAAARVHRHGGSEHRCGLEDRPARVRYRALPPGHRLDKLRRSAGLRSTTTGGRMPVRPPRLVLPPIRRSVGRVRGPGRPVRLRRLRRHAGTDLGDRARPRLAGAEALQSEADAGKKEALFHPAGDKHIHKPLRQGLVASFAPAGRFGHRSRHPACPLRPPLLRSAVDHPDGRLIN